MRILAVAVALLALSMATTASAHEVRHEDLSAGEPGSRTGIDCIAWGSLKGHTYWWREIRYGDIGRLQKWCLKAAPKAIKRHFKHVEHLKIKADNSWVSPHAIAPTQGPR